MRMIPSNFSNGKKQYCICVDRIVDAGDGSNYLDRHLIRNLIIPLKYSRAGYFDNGAATSNSHAFPIFSIKGYEQNV